VWLLTVPFVAWVLAGYFLVFRSGVIGGIVALIEITLGDVRRLLAIVTVALALCTLRPGVPAVRRGSAWIGAIANIIAQAILTANHNH
jgi:hypothetical protein